MRVELPIDHLRELWPKKFRGVRVGALLHPASVSAKLEHASHILEQQNGDLFHLAAFFGPQHGFRGETQDNMAEWKSYEHPRLDIAIYSLYGEHREPTAEMLEDIDLLLVDLQDIGARYYTFIWTMYLCMRACERAGVHVLVLDRPNPINGVATEGPILDPEYQSFVGLHSIPEKTLDTATVYPGMCLLEGTNISEGRGTTRPLEIFGAPFIDAEVLCRELTDLKLPGVYFRENYFEPTFHKFAGQLCGGAQLHVTDRESFRPFMTGVEVIKRIRKTYGEQFQWKQPPYEYEWKRLPIEILIGGPIDSVFGD